MSEPRPPLKHPADDASRHRRKSAVRINELPDTYPTAQGIAAPSQEIALEPVGALAAEPIPFVEQLPPAPPTPAAGYPESPALVFEAIPALPRATLNPPRTRSRIPRRLAWAVGTVVVAVASFAGGMFLGDLRATRRFETAMTKTDPPTVAAAVGKSDAAAADPKKSAAVKPAATKPADTLRKTEPDRSKPADPPQPTTASAFESQVLPILQAKCVVCHGGRAKKGELDVRTVAGLKKGGENGAAVVPGDLNTSVLWEFISNNKMPPGKSGKLTVAEKKTIQDWIVGGAK